MVPTETIQVRVNHNGTGFDRLRIPRGLLFHVLILRGDKPEAQVTVQESSCRHVDVDVVEKIIKHLKEYTLKKYRLSCTCGDNQT